MLPISELCFLDLEGEQTFLAVGREVYVNTQTLFIAPGIKDKAAVATCPSHFNHTIVDRTGTKP